jgi:hypothetical protein
MINILYLPVAVSIVVHINFSPLEMVIQVNGIDERDQREEILIDQKEKEIDGRETGATTAVIRIGTGTVGIGKVIGTEGRDERMILITEKAVRKTKVEDTLLEAHWWTKATVMRAAQVAHAQVAQQTELTSNHMATTKDIDNLLSLLKDSKPFPKPSFC